MFEKSDQRFLESLESPEGLENLLSKLLKSRKWLTIQIGFTLVVFFILFLLSVQVAQKVAQSQPGIIPSLILLMPILFLLNPVILSARALHAHSQIRTLLLFKKLRDDKGIVDP